mmetsp:Transcript_124110/g.241815  ORF Transcript_124110/g.241815 Transcript_124110/m.241815 type:complete len:670 (-) Transcript_124110:69-2078(-)
MVAAHATVVFLALFFQASLATQEGAKLGANPIRRVVKLLQGMQKQTDEEGKKEKKLFEEYMCYCKTGGNGLSKSISAAQTKVPQLESSIKEAESLKVQLQKDVKTQKASIADAKAAIDKATALREKEAKSFSKDIADYKTNIAALGKAITAVDKGIFGGFLQSKSGSRTLAILQQLTLNEEMSSADRDMLSNFLSQSDENSALGSGQILGILKQMKETMEKELAEIIKSDAESKKSFEALVAAKEKELASSQAAVESKISRIAQLGISIVQMKEDLDDTKKGLADDQLFAADLKKSCATKQTEWDERCKTRADELLAIGETIKILNDDDALDLFKKTLPSASFLQMQVSGKEVRREATAALHTFRHKHGHHVDPQLDFIVLALQGKKQGFDAVVASIDKMVGFLHKEQSGDDKKKSYCEAKLDKTEDQKKSLEQKVEDIEKAMAEASETIETLVDEIKGLADSITALDKSVVKATKNRKAENAEYKESMSANAAAKKLLEMAEARLSKFYSGKLVQIRAHDADDAAPSPPPETWDAYKTQGEGAGGVAQMLHVLMADLEKEIMENKVDEKSAQSEYERFIADSSEKRRVDAQALADKESQKADLEKALQTMKTTRKSTLFEAMAKAETLRDLHIECDWLLANFGARQEARSAEIDSLKNAKAVLSGADE